MVDPAASLSIENVVVSTELDPELDLTALAPDLEAQYDPEQFPGLVYRMQDPKAAALIFRSGKLVVTGARSMTAVETAIHATFDAIRELGIPVTDDPDYAVQNIVTSGDLGRALSLNAIAIGLGLEDVEYEPEQFPGLVYRPTELEP